MGCETIPLFVLAPFAKPIELLVFDWDGTLADSEARIVNAIEQACTSLCIPPPSRERARSIIGLGLVEAMEELFFDRDIPQRPDPARLAALEPRPQVNMTRYHGGVRAERFLARGNHVGQMRPAGWWCG